MLFCEKEKALSSLYEKCTKPIRDEYSLTQMEFDIIMFLFNNPEYDRAKDIVELRHLTKSHVSSALKDLIKRNLIEATYHVGNKKDIHLKLSAMTKEICKKGTAIQKKYAEMLFEGFTEEDLKIYQDLFLRVCHNASKGLKD